MYKYYCAIFLLASGSVAAQNPFSVLAENIGNDTRPDYYTYALVAKDMNGDGSPDIVAGNENGAIKRNRIFLSNGSTDPFSGVLGSDISTDEFLTQNLAVGDVNNDGNPDVVAPGYGGGHRLYLNHGTSNPFNGVSGITIASDTGSARGVALADFTGDGRLDVVLGSYNGSGPINLYINNGTADPFNSVTATQVGTQNTWTPNFAVADFNDDGDPDIVTGNRSYGPYIASYLYLNNGSANPFNGVAEIPLPITDSFVFAGDVNGDGDSDIAYYKISTEFGLLLNNGTADPFAGVSTTHVDNIVGSEYAVSWMLLGDVNNDGDLDVLLTYLDGNSRLYVNNGTADPFNGVGPITVLTGVDNIGSALADVDSDADLDLVVSNGLGGVSPSTVTWFHNLTTESIAMPVSTWFVSICTISLVLFSGIFVLLLKKSFGRTKAS